VVAVWVFLLPNLLAGTAGRAATLLALAPFAALVVLALVASVRGFVGGLWFAPWELAVAAAALVLAWLTPGVRRAGRARRTGRKAGAGDPALRPVPRARF
ncbi:MAG TPA: hypothetical protein VIG50_18285, partial [Vicinamibacteria bacterium]